jgi:hypothetical protein
MRVTDTKNNRFYACQDFNLKNLSVVKGEVLPKNWQTPGSIRYLKENFGEDCVIWTDRREDGNGKDQETSEIEILKARIDKMQEKINQLNDNQKPKEVPEKRKLRRKASIK